MLPHLPITLIWVNAFVQKILVNVATAALAALPFGEKTARVGCPCAMHVDSTQRRMTTLDRRDYGGKGNLLMIGRGMEMENCNAVVKYYMVQCLLTKITSSQVLLEVACVLLGLQEVRQVLLHGLRCACQPPAICIKVHKWGV